MIVVRRQAVLLDAADRLEERSGAGGNRPRRGERARLEKLCDRCRLKKTRAADREAGLLTRLLDEQPNRVVARWRLSLADRRRWSDAREHGHPYADTERADDHECAFESRRRVLSF
jgi:hypothetical protein